MVLAMPMVALASPLRAELPGFLSAGALGSLSRPAGDARCNWSRAMIQARSGHSATLLRDGSVMVLGGEDEQGGLLAEPESYDPETGRWTLLTPVAIIPPAARVHHTATLLDNGMVLILGGAGADGEALRSAELYDPASAAWGPAARPRAARAWHSATLLEDGSVLAAGGFAGASQLASAERYAPARDTWTAAASLGAARDGHGAARLLDGRVLIMGVKPARPAWARPNAMTRGSAPARAMAGRPSHRCCWSVPSPARPPWPTAGSW